MPSHGALSKAGKVRSVTPKIDSKKKKSSGPSASNRKLYHKRFVLGRNGQHQYDRRRRR